MRNDTVNRIRVLKRFQHGRKIRTKHRIKKDLDKIKSSVLIISCKQDPHFPPELDGIPMCEMIDDASIVIMDSELGHLCFNELETIRDDLKRFMSDL